MESNYQLMQCRTAARYVWKLEADHCQSEVSEEDFWSTVPDSRGREVQEWVDREVGTPCRIWTHSVGRKYTAGDLILKLLSDQ
jgi:hypothetical protein